MKAIWPINQISLRDINYSDICLLSNAMEREKGGTSISMLVAATGKPITSLRIGRQPGYRARAYKNFI